MNAYEMQTVDGLAPEAVDAWGGVVTGFLAHSRDTAVALEALRAAAPDFALAEATRGLFLLLLGRAELVAPAKAALSAAKVARVRQGQARPERLTAFVDALEAYAAGRPSRAAERLALHLQEAPADVLACKLEHAIRFVLGDRRGMLRGIEAVLPAYAHGHPHRGYVLGCHAFALEENGAYAEAEAAGRAALEEAPDDAWGLHAVAHVLDMTGRSGEGIDWLARQEPAFAHCNNFGAHVWWHLALFHLDRAEYDAVLALYDTRIRAEQTDDYRDIANGASMLTRLEIEGIAVGDRWDELVALSEARVEPGCVVFADLHYLLALEAGGRRGAADAMIARLAADAAAADHDMHEVAALAGLPCARGLTAFRAGAYDAAYEALRDS
ncbi:MAG: tetratricopeptide repeat protein, partial [Pseudomonadota bacterium]